MHQFSINKKQNDIECYLDHSVLVEEPNGLDGNYETISNVISGVFSWTS